MHQSERRSGMIGKLNSAGVRMGEVVRYDVVNDTFVRNKKGFL